VSEALSHASQQSNVLVDLSECTFADSSQINSLLIANMQLQQRGGRVEVVIPPDASAVQRITAITGLAQVVPSTPGATAPGETPKRSRLESGGQVP
jgi:anti-anti-sigma regulatory factor